MKNLLSILLIIVSLSLFNIETLKASKNTTITAHWDSTNVLLMGQVIPLRVEIVQDRGESGTLLTSRVDTLAAGVEVLRTLGGDTTDLGNNRVQINQSLLIQAFDSGLYQLPPVIYLTGDDTIMSDELTLKVIPIRVDTAGGIVDFKPTLAIPRKITDYIPNWMFRYWWLWLVIIAAGVLAYYGMKAYRRYKKHGVMPWLPIKKRLPPYEEAIERLKSIEHSQLWQQGRDKEYHTELTETLRVYIERRYDVSAIEMTTSQILEELKDVDMPSGSFDTLKEILVDADLVKFADQHFDAEINNKAMRQSRQFLEMTKPQPVEEASEEIHKEIPAEVKAKEEPAK